MKDTTQKTMRHLSNEQRTDLAMLLRYRTQTPRGQPRVYATLQEIAGILCRSISWVRNALKLRFCVETHTQNAKHRNACSRSQPPMHYKWKRYHYTMEHQSWLTSPHVLRLQAHLSLAGRCARFHRQYPEMRISVNKIR